MRILFLLLFPVFLSAQINNAYGVIEIGSFPTSSSTGPKFAYRPADSSFYRWSHGSVWVKIIEPSITSDTIFITDQIGTSYVVSGDTINLTPYLLKSDTTAMLVKYIERGDTASMLTNYPTFGDVNTSLGNYLPILGGTLTGTGGAGFLGLPAQSGTPSTPASGFRLFANGAHNLAILDRNGWITTFDISATANRDFTYPSTGGTFALGTGTADRSARWSATNTLAAGNITDNGTKLQALLPWQFQTYTTAGLPTGVTGYTVYNTTTNGPAWYQGSRWAYGLESTFARGTATRVPFFDANGQVTDEINFRFENSKLRIGNGTGVGVVDVNTTALGAVNIFNATGNPGTGSSAALIFNVLNTNATNNKTQFVFGGNSSARQWSFGADPYGVGNNVFFLYANGTGSTPMWVTTDGRVRLGKSTLPSAGSTNPYSLYVDATDGIGVPRGTVAQRPTWVTATNPFRFNTDSTALEYATALATWNLVATRDYARSLVSSLPTTNIYTADGTLSGNRIITGGNSNITWDNVTAFQIQSGGVTPGATILSDVYYSQRQNYNQAKSRYFTKYQSVDTRLITGTNRPNFVDILEWSFGGGALYEWDRYISLDTTNNVFFSKSGSQDYPHFNRFVTRRPATGTTYQTTPRWAWVATAGTENANANTIHTIWGRTDALIYMTLKDEGKFMLAPDSTFIFDPLDDVLKLSQYGTGTKEAADLSKTQSAYIAGFATDGTLLDYPISGLGNGIYSSSGTLSNHTTRARVPDDGNLFFSQTYNGGADSSFFYFANATSGERYVGLGMTDTASTGGASLLFGNDGTGEMSFELQTIDAVNGNTQIRGVSGDLNMSSSAGNISLSTNVANEVRVTGLIRSKQEAYYEITSTSSPQTFSNDYSDNFVNQGGTQASFTFLFPASPEDGQILSMTWNNAISVLTLDGNGNTITGTAVTTAVAGTRRQFKYYASASAWIKIY